MMNRNVWVAGLVPAFFLFQGCAAAPSSSNESAPAPAQGSIDSQQATYYSTFTMTAAKPVGNDSTMTHYGAVTITGSGTAPMGACMLNHVWTGDFNAQYNPTCSVDTDCNAYAPAGGHAYCAAPDNSGTKTCWIRLGSQADWCAGSPAMGGAAVGAGTYYTNTHSAWETNASVITGCGLTGGYQYVCTSYTEWMMLGCFYGCSGANGAPTTPSLSTVLTAYSQNPYQGYY